MNEQDIIKDVEIINQRLQDSFDNFKLLTEARIIHNNTRLVDYISLIYYRSCYNLLRGTIHASPGLWAFVAAVVIMISNIIIIARYIFDILRIVEILQVMDILRIVWPEFRAKYDEILGKLSEVSGQLGFGADGLAHLIQTTQSSITLLGGVLGKSDDWSEISIMVSSLKVTERIATLAHGLENDPSHYIAAIFREQDWKNKREVANWWDKTVSWITDTADKAEIAIIKVNDTIDDLMELRNKLPQFIRDHIPEKIFLALDWMDNQIDDTILPALTNISNELTIINKQLETERESAARTLRYLARPGDLLLNIDLLNEEDKGYQEIKIDDVTSRLYEKQTDKIYEADSNIIAGLESIRKLGEMDIPAPEFMGIEEMTRKDIVLDPIEEKVGWFVGDF